MGARKLFNGLMILTLLLPTLVTTSATPTSASESLRPTAHGRTLSAENVTDGLSVRPFAEAGYEERGQTGRHEVTSVQGAPLSAFNASVVQ